MLWNLIHKRTLIRQIFLHSEPTKIVSWMETFSYVILLDGLIYQNKYNIQWHTEKI